MLTILYCVFSQFMPINLLENDKINVHVLLLCMAHWLHRTHRERPQNLTTNLFTLPSRADDLLYQRGDPFSYCTLQTWSQHKINRKFTTRTHHTFYWCNFGYSLLNWISFCTNYKPKKEGKSIISKSKKFASELTATTNNTTGTRPCCFLCCDGSRYMTMLTSFLTFLLNFAAEREYSFFAIEQRKLRLAGSSYTLYVMLNI